MFVAFLQPPLLLEPPTCPPDVDARESEGLSMGRCTNRPRSIQFTGVKVKADSTLYKPEDSSLFQGSALWSRSSERIQDRKTEVEWKDEDKPRAAHSSYSVHDRLSFQDDET